MLKKTIEKYIRKRVQSGVENELQKYGFTPIAETADKDVFVIGFPKSGNTWLLHIVAHLYYGLNYNQSKNLISMIVPDRHETNYYRRINETCFFKSHELPSPQFKKVIYIYRDGRDALYSYYMMEKGKNKDVSLEDFFMEDKPMYPCKWHEHLEAWVRNPYDAEILYVRYEDLKKTPQQVFAKIADFINARHTNESIEYCIEQTSFKTMTQLEKNDAYWKEQKQKKGWTETGQFVRKGAVGDYMQNVPKHLIDEFNAYSETVLKQHNYEIL